jgi:hypothetical protein
MSIEKKYKFHKVLELPLNPEVNSIYFLSTLTGNTFQEYLTDINGVYKTLSFGGNGSQFVKGDGSLDNTIYQPLLTNPVTGTGTLNFLSKFNSPSGLTNSQIFDNGTNIGINTIEPTNKLDVNGTIRIRTINNGIGNFLTTDINGVINKRTANELLLDIDAVPYTGATKNVNFGEFGLSAGHIVLDTTPTNIPNSQGSIYWDVDDNTVDIKLNGYIMKVGEDQFYPVKNQTGLLITKGTSVRFAGTIGSSGRLLIEKFIANGSIPSQFFMGVTAEDIPDGEDGKVTWFGRVRGINTDLYNEGDILYASTTVAGGFQTTVPQAPNNIVQIAAVITKSVNVGTIFVRPTIGSNINNDEGIKITSGQTGDILQLQSNGLFENKTKGQYLGGTSSQFVKGDGSLDSTIYTPTGRTLTISGTTNQVIVSPTSAQDLSANRIWTLSLPQNIHTGATPTFAGLTVNGTTTTNTLVVGTLANKATITYATNTARTLTLPNLGGDRTFAFINEAQTFNVVQTFSSQLVSSVATGTAPFSVASTTRVANLNVATAGTADVWTTARNFTIGNTTRSVDGSSGYTWTLTDIGAVPTGRTLTISGTTNQVTVSLSGAQNLSADRIWTLSLPQNIHTGATPTFAGLTVNGSIGLRASGTTSTITHIPVFTADPTSTTRTIQIKNVSDFVGDLITDINAIPNTSLNTYEKANLIDQRESTKLTRIHYDNIIDDGGNIENYLYLGDFFIGKTGHIIRDVIINQGVVTDIKTDFIRVEDLPLIPATYIIDNYIWAPLSGSTNYIQNQFTSAQSAEAWINGRLQVGNIKINNNTIFSENTNGNIILSPNGNGSVEVNSNLLIGTQTNKATITYITNQLRTYTIPDAGGNADFVMNGGNQTIGGIKTFSSQLVSSVATGTAPFSVASTTRVANLNVATAGTADVWTTARNFTIGNTTRSVDGSSGYTWTLTDIGAVPTGRTLTISGTTNQVIVSPTSAQDLSANRIWTLSLPQNIHTGATPTFAGLTVNGSIGLRASATSSTTTQIPVFTADPTSTTRTLVTRTPSQLLGDLAGLPLSGGTMTGFITLHADPTQPLHATTKQYVDNVIAANDAMVFKGTLGVGGTYSSLPTTHNVGWTIKVITAGTYAGQVAEIGDMYISLVSRTGTGNLNSDWTVIQTNIDGAVIGPSNSTNNALALFDGVTGKLIKNSTFIPTTVGGNLINLTNNSTSAKYIRVESNNTLTYRTISDVLGDIGAVPTGRTLTISGTTNQVIVSPTSAQDLSANRIWTLSLPQNIHTGATPTFAGLTVNGTTTTNTLVVGTLANKATITYATNTARTLTLPNLGGDRTFAFINEAQTFSVVQTFSSQLVSSVATGTAPFSVASTTRVANLNVTTAGTADVWTTARNFTIGNTTRSVDGSSGYTWTLTDIGAVTSVAAGNGLNFTTITGSGSVTLGTPSTLTVSTTNGVTTTSHTHVLDLSGRSVIAGDGLTGGGDLSANRTFAVDSTVSRRQFVGNVDTVSPWRTYILICRLDSAVGLRKFSGRIFGARRSGNTSAATIYLTVSDTTTAANVSYSLRADTIQNPSIRMVSLTTSSQNWMALEIDTTEFNVFDSTQIWADWDYLGTGISLSTVPSADVSVVTPYASHQQIQHIFNGTIVGYVPSIRTITSGTGLTGGGDLSANRTLSVVFGTTAGTVAQGNDSRFHNAVTIGTANGLSLSTQVLSLALASTSTTGALSSTDWNTFNNKQNALTNPITGTGTAGQVSFWTGAGTQSGDSGLIWDNTNKSLTVSGLSSLFWLSSGNNLDGEDIIFRIGGGVSGSSRLSSIRKNTTTNILSIYASDGGGTAETRFYRNNSTESWRITSNGILQSNGAQTLQTSTGALTIATGGGNDNILLTPHGTGNIGIGTTSPTNTLDVNGTTRVRTITNATGNFVTKSDTGVLQERTPSQTLTDIGAVPTGRTLTINGTTNQVTVSLSGAQNLSVNRTWTLSLPQNIHTGATPTFAGLTVNGSIGLRASSGTTATHFAVFGSNPSGTTTVISSRALSDVKNDLGINSIGGNFHLMSAGTMFTTTEAYESIFSNGSNIISGALRSFNHSKIENYDTIRIEINYRNITTTSDKLGILRFKLGTGSDRFLETVPSTTAGPISGRFVINIIKTSSTTYSVFAAVYINEGSLNTSNRNLFFTETISADWGLTAEYFSALTTGSGYGGSTAIHHQIYYMKATEGVFVDPVV